MANQNRLVQCKTSTSSEQEEKYTRTQLVLCVGNLEPLATLPGASLNLKGLAYICKGKSWIPVAELRR